MNAPLMVDPKGEIDPLRIGAAFDLLLETAVLKTVHSGNGTARTKDSHDHSTVSSG
jgi:hypothetical protein